MSKWLAAFYETEPDASFIHGAKNAKIVKNSLLLRTPPISGNYGNFGRRWVIHSWEATDWRAYYDERAAIAEHDGGLSRQEAEKQAFDCCIARWLRMHGSEHMWLHGDAARASAKIQEAVKGLTTMGVSYGK